MSDETGYLALKSGIVYFLDSGISWTFNSFLKSSGF